MALTNAQMSVTLHNLFNQYKMKNIMALLFIEQATKYLMSQREIDHVEFMLNTEASQWQLEVVIDEDNVLFKGDISQTEAHELEACGAEFV